ncbi:hypothetical protein SAY86_010605 [Trapa natans]|uniref:Uncharacterized protein n=1 Tax=Trapa natans TaxID=22666 RepID=A0AAN7LVB0_TRANT|nr:hypothetical protein SAY86_010605 [Trapa natans]
MWTRYVPSGLDRWVQRRKPQDSDSGWRSSALSHRRQDRAARFSDDLVDFAGCGSSIQIPGLRPLVSAAAAKATTSGDFQVPPPFSIAVRVSRCRCR